MKRNGSTLASLRKGQKGIIAAVNAVDPQVQRLMTLGLVEGAIVEMASCALGGDPMVASPGAGQAVRRVSGSGGR
jgi:Fe2+ transport system protein FeoA